MDHDHLAVKRAQALSILWQRDTNKYITPDIGPRVKFPKGSATISYFKQGAYNCCYKLERANQAPHIIRLPILGFNAFRPEKVVDEATVIKYLQKHTSIPVPQLLEAEMSSFGPYIRMEFLEGTSLSELLRVSNRPDQREVLNLNIDTKLLDQAYRCMAEVILQMWKCRFKRIGGLTQDSGGIYSVSKRPLSLHMNRLVTLANFPPQNLCQTAFDTANEYFRSLAEMHITHLRTQRNDSFLDEVDCRKKYVARQLFLKIAENFSKDLNHGPFPLFCDDLRPSNVMVDEKVCLYKTFDWDFSYAAPAEFTIASPWWLLLLHPDDWQGDLDDFLHQYRPLHERFVKIMTICESEEIDAGRLPASERLSSRMKTSLEDGTFWFCLAATSSDRFDEIFWKYLDRVYFGSFDSIEERVTLLGSDTKKTLNDFVEFKLTQAQPKTLDDHRTMDEMLV